MDLTSLDLPEKLVLRALFELARRDCPAQADVVARVLGLDVAMVARLSERLAARGLIDAPRARLTLAGLAVAVRTPSLPAVARARLPAAVADEARFDGRVPLRLVSGERGSHG